MELATEKDLDLVEVAPDARPPVTRLLDYSKYRYEQEQKAKAARKHQQQVNVREIKLRPKIADHDYGTKKGHVMRFLRHGDKVKVTIMFRGREQAHPERGRALLRRLFEDLEGLAVIESRGGGGAHPGGGGAFLRRLFEALGGLGVMEPEPLQEGRNMSMLVAPSAAARPESDNGSDGDKPGAAPPEGDAPAASDGDA